MNHFRPIACILLAGIALTAADTRASEPTAGPPETVGMASGVLERLDDVVTEAIARDETRGAVLWVERKDVVVWRKAYGHRQVQPEDVTMTLDTVFDMASLTKVMATATSIMVLVDEGKLRVDDLVTEYIPEFGQNDKEQITVEQLLTHRAGFIPDNPVADYEDGRDKAFERIYALKPIYEPGTRFRYSDVGYIVLGEIVARVSGEPLEEFSRKHVFEPLGMRDTRFLPGDELKARTAPTERRDGNWIVGEVHDPRSYLMGGVAGHAGLFSTAEDVARYARAILSGGAPILKSETVRRMTSWGDLPLGERRGLGWDMDTGFSSPRGDLFPIGGYGHTGFTGTSLWIDPVSETFVIILSSRLHPDGGNVTRLRRVVASTVAASILAGDGPAALPVLGTAAPLERKAQRARPELPVTRAQPAHQRGALAAAPPADDAKQPVLCGIDVLRRDGFKWLADRRVGLITNHTGLARDGATTIDLLHEATNVQLVALFSPEHGIRGVLDRRVDDSVDEKTGLHIWSLYGKTRRPTPEMLEGIDTLVFDIQDIGTRFYTFVSTLGYAMEEAAKHGIRVVVLDRPNPIGGEHVAGPVLDAGRESFVGYHNVPVRHGMTAGELARMFNTERGIDCDLQIVTMEGWHRSDYFDATGLTWVNPSPNMRNLTEALLYPGIGLLETTNVSVGRGTDTPFEVIGAPWLDGRWLAAALNQADLPGVRFVPIRFTPDSSTHRGQECGGVNILITHRAAFEPLRTGITIAHHLRARYPDQWTVDRYQRLLGDAQTLTQLKRGTSPEQIEAAWQDELADFRKVRQRHLLYE